MACDTPVPESPASSGYCTPRAVYETLMKPGGVYAAQHSAYNTFRRLRSPGVGTRPDAAGMINSAGRYHGRATPVKGHVPGAGLESAGEKPWRCGKRVTPVSHKAEKGILVHDRNPAMLQVDTALFCKDKTGHWKTTTGPRIRTAPACGQDHLNGAAGIVVHPEPIRRPWRKPAPKPHDKTKGRVFVWAEDVEHPPLPHPTPRQEVFSKSMTDAREFLRLDQERPMTAPAAPNLARRYRIMADNGHADVLAYRFSNGICPAEYKLCGDRMPGPQVTRMVEASAHTSFADSRSTYTVNKCRGLMSNFALYA